MLDNTNITDNINNSNESHDELAELLVELNLNSSVPFLRDVKKCLTVEHISPTEDIIRFFDAIYTVSVSQIANVTVSKMFADDNEIVRSFSDVYKKADYLCPKQTAALTVCDVLPTASAYLKTLGVNPIEMVTTDKKSDLSIVAENGEKLVDLSFGKASTFPYGYIDETEIANNKDKNSFVPEGTQLFLVSADEEKYEKFSTDARFREICIASATVDPRGTLYAILSLAYGATVELSAFSEAPRLIDLIYACHTERIIAVPFSLCDTVTNIASAYDVQLKKIALTIKEPSIRFNHCSEEISIRAGFLRRLFEYKTEAIPKISADEFAPTDYEPLFYTTGNAERHSFNDTLVVGGHIVSAKYTKECSFTTAINVVLDTVFSLLAKGIDRRKIGITLKISSKNHDSAFAATLGAYRVIMELCTALNDSDITLSDDDFIFCTAFAKLDEKKTLLSDKFVGTEDKNAVYFASFKRFYDTSPALMPDFSELREMCEFIYSAVSEGKILSARSVNASVISAAKDMCDEDTELVFIDTCEVTESTNAQGFVIEVDADSKPNAPILGYLNKKNYDSDDLYRGTTYVSKW